MKEKIMKKKMFISGIAACLMAFASTGCSSIEHSYQREVMQVIPVAAGDGEESIESDNNTIWRVTKDKKAADISICIKSQFDQLSSAPQLRMSKTLAITAKCESGTRFAVKGNLTAENQKIYKDQVTAKKQLNKMTQDFCEKWVKNVFTPYLSEKLGCITVKIRKDVGKMDFTHNYDHFQQDAGRWVSNHPGVIMIRQQKGDRNNNLTAFRLLYWKNITNADMLLKEIIKKSER